MTLKAVLFDVDGTLADTERDGHRVAFNLAFAEAGLDWNWDVALYGKLLAVTGGKERIKFFLQDFHRDFPKPADLDGFAANLHKTKTKFYTQLMADGAVPLRPGVERLIEELRAADIRLGIATTTTPANVTALLTHTLGEHSLDWFEVIAAGDIIPAKKPGADIYHWALGRMNLTFRDAVALEDSQNGVKSAVAAGLTTLVTYNDYTLEDDFTGAKAVLSDLGEPHKAIEQRRICPFNEPYVTLETLRNLLLV